MAYCVLYSPMGEILPFGILHITFCSFLRNAILK